MPLALGHWGICSVCSRAARTDKNVMPTMWITRHTLSSSLRSLPAKTAALAKTAHGRRLCAAIKSAHSPA
ncbi:Competence protein F homolog,phosphoribosyltransferase domain; protein YhgH required for utilization of DNA as sole source of carbon and energy [Escherichia coli ISC41]|nr:Competence protein F homolog,phosphoribosyltransferase domain; protein YhgH required for utilization of DNA as sole source of carbon and energy [Escherichia coli ISC41]